MTEYDFKRSSLNQTLLRKVMDKNVDAIYNSPTARRGRTRAQVEEFVGLGIPCEVFMIEHKNCHENIKLYGDVTDENGVEIECKASKYFWSEKMKIDMKNKIKPYTPAKLIMFWQTDGENYKYSGFIKM